MSDEQEVPEVVTPAVTSARFLTGDLIKVCVEQLRQEQVPFSMLTEAQQQKVIARITKVVSNAAREAVKIIAALGRPRCEAEIESVTFKDGIRVSLAMNKGQVDRHAIADAQGDTVLLVLPDYDAVAGGDPPKPEPDQSRLPLDDAAPDAGAQPGEPAP